MNHSSNMKVKNILPNEATEILSEESLQVIESAFSKKLQLTVEAALTEQDDLYSKKLEQLINAIDKDHTTKLKRVVEAVDKNNAGKLVKVVKHYERALTTEAKGFKTTLTEAISNYLEEFLDEAIPTAAINEATKNRTAREVLGNLRKVLAIDSALMSESVQSAVVDGKNQIDTLTQQVAALTKENTLVKESYFKTKSSLLIETKTAGLSDKKKEYIKRVLNDKTPKFIEENFDYTLRLFDKKEKENIDILREEAFSARKVKADAPVIRESIQPKQEQSNPYLAEMQKYK
jgi:hypothetical protein